MFLSSLPLSSLIHIQKQIMHIYIPLYDTYTNNIRFSPFLSLSPPSPNLVHLSLTSPNLALQIYKNLCLTLYIYNYLKDIHIQFDRYTNKFTSLHSLPSLTHLYRPPPNLSCLSPLLTCNYELYFINYNYGD